MFYFSQIQFHFYQIPFCIHFLGLTLMSIIKDLSIQSLEDSMTFRIIKKKFLWQIH